MDREEKIFAVLGIFITVIFGIFQVLEWLGVTPQVLIPYSTVLVQGCIVGLIFIAMIALSRAWVKRHHALDHRFLHLTIHYSSRLDSPDNPVPHEPRFVSNNMTKQAYSVPTLLEQPIRQHKISWRKHDNENTLREYLADQEFNTNPKDPSPEELGLMLKPNGSLVPMEPALEPEMLEKLVKRKLEGKLENYFIAFLYPRYCWFFPLDSVKKRVQPPSKRVLADTSSNEAFGAPVESWDLACRDLVSSDNFTLRPWDLSIGRWCKSVMGWTYNKDKRFTVEELAGIRE